MSIRDVVSEAKASDASLSKQKESSLRKVKIYESLMQDEEWDAHTSVSVMIV